MPTIITTCPPDFQTFLRPCCIHMQSERIKNVLVHIAKAVQHSHKHPSHHERKNERVTCDMFHCFTLPSPTSGKAELTLAAAPWASTTNFVLKETPFTCRYCQISNTYAQTSITSRRSKQYLTCFLLSPYSSKAELTLATASRAGMMNLVLKIPLQSLTFIFMCTHKKSSFYCELEKKELMLQIRLFNILEFPRVQTGQTKSYCL